MTLERRLDDVEQRLGRVEAQLAPAGLLGHIADTLDEHTSLLRDLLTLFRSHDERLERIENYLRPPSTNGPGSNP